VDWHGIVTDLEKKSKHPYLRVDFHEIIRFLGVLIPFRTEKAEIIPVEPEQGNACAGKVVNL
jgi:hypothetical protein